MHTVKSKLRAFFDEEIAPLELSCTFDEVRQAVEDMIRRRSKWLDDWEEGIFLIAAKRFHFTWCPYCSCAGEGWLAKPMIAANERNCVFVIKMPDDKFTKFCKEGPGKGSSTRKDLHVYGVRRPQS